MTLSAEQQEIKDGFLRARGTWDEAWQRMLELDPEFVRASAGFLDVPRRGGALEPKVRALLAIAVDAAATGPHLPGVREHVAAARAHGATDHEILEVLELTSTLGIHAANIGVPLLIEVLVEEGLRSPDHVAELDERQERLKAEFTATRGYWHTFWDGLLELDPDLFEAYVAFSSVPWHTGTLEPKVKEFVYCAFDVAATHLYVPGFKLHLRNALGYGATTAEILEVIEIASVLGLRAATSVTPILAEL